MGAKHKIVVKSIDLTYEPRSGIWGKAEGEIDGLPFVSYQRPDYQGGPRGAEPLRWRSYLVGGKAEITKGQNVAIARRLRKMERERGRL